jgi:hypothetical protein
MGKTDLSFTPKIHSAIAHAIEQVKRLEGIGDVLEDDLEHLHHKHLQKLHHLSAGWKIKISKLSCIQKKGEKENIEVQRM